MPANDLADIVADPMSDTKQSANRPADQAIELRDQWAFGSAELLARKLRRHERFQTISAWTVARWTRQGGVSKARIDLAKRVLDAALDPATVRRFETEPVRIALPRSLAVLPILLSAIPHGAHPRSRLERLFGIRSTVQLVGTGEECLQLFEQGEADIVCVGDELAVRDELGATRVCRISRTPLWGCGPRLRDFVDGQSGDRGASIVVGYPKGSAVRTIVEPWLALLGKVEFVPCEDPAEGACRLADPTAESGWSAGDRVDGLIAWVSWTHDAIRSHRKMLGAAGSRALLPFVCGRRASQMLDMQLLVRDQLRRDPAGAAALRALLLCIRDVGDYIGTFSHRSTRYSHLVETIHAMDSEFEEREIRDALKHSTFAPDEFNMRAIVESWHAEAGKSDSEAAAEKRPMVGCAGVRPRSVLQELELAVALGVETGGSALLGLEGGIFDMVVLGRELVELWQDRDRNTQVRRRTRCQRLCTVMRVPLYLWCRDGLPDNPSSIIVGCPEHSAVTPLLIQREEPLAWNLRNSRLGRIVQLPAGSATAHLKSGAIDVLVAWKEWGGSPAIRERAPVAMLSIDLAINSFMRPASALLRVLEQLTAPDAVAKLEDDNRDVYGLSNVDGQLLVHMWHLDAWQRNVEPAIRRRSRGRSP